MIRHLILLALALILSACQDSTAPQLHTRDTIPARLSDWQIVQVNDQQLVLNPAVLPYDLATPLFSDYALKLRTLWLPDGATAKLTDTGSLDFPVGTVISKTFYYPRARDAADAADVQQTEQRRVAFDGASLALDQVRLIETRLLVHQTDGWQALPYVWNDEQTDATLQITGAVKRLRLHSSEDSDAEVESFAYVVPNRNECAACHNLDQNQDTLSPIGPSVANLNHELTADGSGQNQLTSLWSRRWLAEEPAVDELPESAVWQPGATDSLEHRARSYLDVNCGHCHQPGGSGDTSGLFLHTGATLPLELGVCKPPVAAGRGSGGRPYSIVPGRPEHSILSFRIESSEVGVLMPEVGRSLTHNAGLMLINEWILNQAGRCS
ncbi:MAG TPA: hypothetical protein DEG76_03735 [Pseudohongiella sp.]|nr:hypothetical protein [Pseudohongiella sp.]HBX36447.1 hypothetical protein [Pseudohongiella sp.]|tara:strand:- start:4081 stop:5223 length:1143 start_codon:yes stop_codon:yes gene_type:complete